MLFPGRPWSLPERTVLVHAPRLAHSPSPEPEYETRTLGKQLNTSPFLRPLSSVSPLYPSRHVRATIFFRIRPSTLLRRSTASTLPSRARAIRLSSTFAPQSCRTSRFLFQSIASCEKVLDGTNTTCLCSSSNKQQSTTKPSWSATASRLRRSTLGK